MASALTLVDNLLSTIDKYGDNESKSESDCEAVDLLKSKMKWLNEPSDKSSIKITSSSLQFDCDLATDFWITPELNRHTGHFYYMDAVQGNFIVYVKICGEYATIYDQMGLMLIKDKGNWLKTGIEFVNEQYVSCVVTKGYSDWSVSPIHASPKSIELKLSRSKSKIVIQYRVPHRMSKWYLLRKFQFFDAPLQVGMMSCTPQRKDKGNKFSPRFESFSLTRYEGEIDDPVPD